jgi:hypothetical protein
MDQINRTPNSSRVPVFRAGSNLTEVGTVDWTLYTYLWVEQLRFFHPLSYIIGNRDSAVGIATGYGLDDRWVGVRASAGARFFSSPHYPDRFSVNPASCPMGTGEGLFPEGKVDSTSA